MTRHFSIGILTAAVVAIALIAAGCGGSSKKASSPASTASSTGSTSTSKPGGKAQGEVPAKIKSKGTLTIASDATYAPNEFIAVDGHTVEGMDADLAKALGSQLGLKVKVVNATFDTIIPGLQAGKYDLGMSSFSDTKAREKVVDFVTYFSAGTAFYVKASGGPTINTLADLCGKKVAAERGTTQAMDATTQNGKCKSSGKGAVKVLVFPDQNGVNLAIASGRADVGMADSPVVDYLVKQSQGKFKVTGKVYGTAPYGIAIPKGNGMTKPILDGLKQLLANGQYKSILTKWGIAKGGISNPTINGATS